MDNREIVIGIDPGVNNGFALWNGKEYTQCKALPFWELLTILEYNSQSTVTQMTVIIENPNIISGIYNRYNQEGRYRDKIVQAIGSNKRTAQLLIEWCDLNMIDCIKVRPTGSKWTSDDMKKITGYKGRTNEHGRDAARFVFRYLNERKIGKLPNLK